MSELDSLAAAIAQPAQITTVENARVYALEMAHEVRKSFRATARFYWEMGTALAFVQGEFKRKKQRTFGKFLDAFGSEVQFGERSLYNAIAVADHFPTADEAAEHSIREAVTKANAKGLTYSPEYQHQKPKPKPKPKPPESKGKGGVFKPEIKQPEVKQPPFVTLRLVVREILGQRDQIKHKRDVAVDLDAIRELVAFLAGLPE
jgi:hypothetical protein